MKKKLAITLLAILFLCFAGLAQATIVDLTVSTDKSAYQLGEYVTISVTAYNPNPEPVTLYFPNGPVATYIMGGTYNMPAGYLPVLTSKTIQPNMSFTWNMLHDQRAMRAYPLGIGTHTVVGKLLAHELGEDNMTLPLQFEVIPEPATLLLFSIGTLLLRKSHK
jgi:hypothetical protein